MAQRQDPVGRAIGWVIIDCADPDAVSRFWSSLLGWPVKSRKGPYVFLERPPNGGPGMGFQRVAEPKRAKNRVHLDLEVEDVAATVQLVEELGGRRVPGYEAGGFCVMADPEGNEFCLLPMNGLILDEHGNAEYA